MLVPLVHRVVFVLAFCAMTQAALAQGPPPQSFEQVHVKAGTHVIVLTVDGKKHEWLARTIGAGFAIGLGIGALVLGSG